jgi:hypothetical protein
MHCWIKLWIGVSVFIHTPSHFEKITWFWKSAMLYSTTGCSSKLHDANCLTFDPSLLIKALHATFVLIKNKKNVQLPTSVLRRLKWSCNFVICYLKKTIVFDIKLIYFGFHN